MIWKTASCFLLLCLMINSCLGGFVLDSIIQFQHEEQNGDGVFYHLQTKSHRSKPIILFDFNQHYRLLLENPKNGFYSKPFVTATSKMCLASYFPPSSDVPVTVTKHQASMMVENVKREEKVEDAILDVNGNLMKLQGNDSDYQRDNSFGWNATALRGHVYSSTDKSLVIIAIKGTSVPYSDDKETVANDKYNDNMMFSCCCARMAYSYSSICTCPSR